MAGLGPGVGRGPRTGGENDIYTVLVLIAFLSVFTATIYVGFRAVELFGTLLPPPGS